MKISSILIFFLLYYSKLQVISPICACDQLTQQYDCEYAGCNWVTDEDSNQKCEAFNDPCGQYKSQKTCDYALNCAWTSEKNCTIFTQCSDYKTNEKDYNFNECFYKGQYSCIPGNVNLNGTLQCTDRTLPCSDIQDPHLCSGFIAGEPTSFCWFSTSCQYQNVANCTTITNSDVCQLFGCVYYNNTCNFSKCSDFIYEQDCEFYNFDSYRYYPMCSWVNKQCIETEISTLDSTSCQRRTQGTYSWQGENCQNCQQSGVKQANYLKVVYIIFGVSLSLILLLVISFVIHKKCKQNQRSQVFPQSKAYLNKYMPAKKLQSINNLERKDCVCCQSLFQINEEIRVTYCQHVYHSKCILDYVQQLCECPACKASLKENVLKEKVYNPNPRPNPESK